MDSVIGRLNIGQEQRLALRRKLAKRRTKTSTAYVLVYDNDSVLISPTVTAKQLAQIGRALLDIAGEE